MTVTLTKGRLAVAILAVAMLVPATAYATHVFDDVADDAFYADPVEWAFDNSITTGKSATSFAPLDSVTRGESVTFLKRYDDNIVQPAISSIQTAADTAQATADAAQTRLDVVEVAVDELESLVAPLTNSVAAFASGNSDEPLSATDTVYQTLSLNVPAAGIVVVNSSADAQTSGGTALEARCSITVGTSVDTTHLQFTHVPVGDQETLSGTRGFNVAAGDEFSVNLVCDAAFGAGAIRDASLTAIFAPS